MQKKIIALAIASVFAAPALALADAGNVVVYGQANVSYDMVDTGDGVVAPVAGKQGTSSNRVTSNSSRFGLKGSEDLGGGLSAIWQIESEINLDSGSGTLAHRNSFAGLSSSSMGTLTLGNMDTPYKSSTERLDVFKDGIADFNSLMGGVAMNAADLSAAISGSLTGLTAPASSAVSFDSRSSNLVSYTTPNFNNGFSASAAYSNKSQSNTLNTDTEVSATSLSGSYDVAPFYATVAYEAHKIDRNGPLFTSNKETATKFGLGYTMDALTLGAVYEKTKDDFGSPTYTDALGHKAYYVSAKFNVSATDAIKVGYTKVGNLGNDGTSNMNTGAKQISVGYDHALSKQTTVYALYTKLDNEDSAAYGLAGGGAYNSNAGASPRAISFGMKHSF